MIAQRRLANLKLSSYFGLGDAESRSALDQRAMGIGRHIFGWHFTFPIAQPRDARALRYTDKVWPQTRLRFLLADDPGAGKTIMAGLLIKEMKLREAIDRILILCPAPLTIQWQD